MRGRFQLAAVGGLVLALGMGIFLSGTDRPRPDVSLLTAQAQRRNFEVQVQSVGDLEAARATVVSSDLPGDKGKIIWIIEEGARVQAKDALIRLDPTPFEERVVELEALVGDAEANIKLHQQILEWDKIQAEREIRNAEFDLKVKKLDQVRLEKGDGPLELARLEGGARDAQVKHDESKGYVKDLRDLEERGFANPAEIQQAVHKADEARRAHEAAQRQFDSYQKYVLPAKLETARARHGQAEYLLEQTRRSSGLTIGKAMAKLQQVRNELAAHQAALVDARSQLERTVIRAPIPGLVVLREQYRGGESRKPRVGDVVIRNQPLVYLPDITSMVVQTRVREVDLHKVEAGKRATMAVDAYPDLQLKGSIDSIGVLAKTQLSSTSREKYFQVAVTVEGSHQRLRPGMTVRVAIHAEKVTDALCVPVSAVFFEGDRPTCYLPATDGYAAQEVEVGVQNEDWIEIRRGLDAGQKVALSRPATSRVRHQRSLPTAQANRG